MNYETELFRWTTKVFAVLCWSLLLFVVLCCSFLFSVGLSFCLLLPETGRVRGPLLVAVWAILPVPVLWKLSCLGELPRWTA